MYKDMAGRIIRINNYFVYGLSRNGSPDLRVGRVLGFELRADADGAQAPVVVARTVTTVPFYHHSSISPEVLTGTYDLSWELRPAPSKFSFFDALLQVPRELLPAEALELLDQMPLADVPHSLDVPTVWPVLPLAPPAAPAGPPLPLGMDLED